MSQLTEQLVEQVRALSDEDQDRLLDQAYRGYDRGTPEERAALKAELTRIWERLRSGEEVAISADEAIAELRRRSGARRAAP